MWVSGKLILSFLPFFMILCRADCWKIGITKCSVMEFKEGRFFHVIVIERITQFIPVSGMLAITEYYWPCLHL